MQLSSDGITIRELHATTALGRATLRAGLGGLDRAVRRVQWMEVLDDFADYLDDGDLLLTTAYNLRDEPKLQSVLAARMLGCGVSAMVIKCGYYLDDVPYPLRRQADSVDLPVFELPREVPFVELSQSIYERLVSSSYARLRRSASLHRELVQLLAEGASLAGIVGRAAAVLGNPVLVEDAAGRLLAGARPSGAPLTTGSVPPGALVVPVVARGAVHGRIALLREHAVSADDAQALEQVATVVALEIARSEHEVRADRERVAAFVRDLVGGSAGGEEEARRKAAVVGVALPDRPAAVVLEGDAAPEGCELWRAGGGRLVAVVDAADAMPADRAGGIAASEGGVDGLPAALARAERAWRLGTALTGERRLHRYDDIETYDLLVGHLDGTRLARLRGRTLERLPDALRETLVAYTAAGGSVSATASRLYVHRNTIRYRLRRIEQLSGLDLSRAEDRLLCELLLLAERVSEVG